jgi:hypothetical protein
MIIYGTNGSLRRSEPAPGLVCPACSNPDRMQLSVFSRYAHVYWLPLFPYSKPVVAQCGHCKGAWTEKELPAEAAQLKQAAQLLRKHTSAPWWQWSGLALLAAGLVWAFVASRQDDQANADYLAAPRVGDVYTVHESDSARRYSLLKVVAAHGNTVELVANDYDIDNRHPLEELNQPEKYSKEPFTLTQLDLTIMRNKGQLIDVDRIGE